MKRVVQFLITMVFVVGLTCPSAAGESEKGNKPARRLLLIGQGPDGHPFSTHEYMAAMELTAKMLHRVPGLQTIIVKADEPWKDGPELLDGADGAVVFVSEGAKWLNHDKGRLAAFERLAKRGGGLVALHWGMGTRDAKNIKGFVDLFGGCHGGDDRRYKVVDVTARVVNVKHPVTRGIKDFEVHDEFYYKLKFPKPAESITPLLGATIEGERETVSWAWQRPDRGRSFGFSGLHFHKNWQLAEYRRLVTQGILWTLKVPIPKEGFNVDVSEATLRLKPRTADKK